MNSPFSARPIRNMIIMGFSLALLAVATMGYFTYINVQELAESLTDAAEPSEQLIELNKLEEELITMESMIKNYTITQNNGELNEYFFRSDKVNTILKKVYEISETDTLIRLRLNIIGPLVDQKLNIHQRIIKLIGNEGIIAQFDVLARKYLDVDSLTVEDPWDTDGSNRTPADAQPIIERFQTKLEEISEAEQVKADEIIRLTKEDQVVMREIRSRIDRVEVEQRIRRTIKAEEAVDSQSKTLRFIAIFTILFLIISAILMAIIFGDLQRNTRLQKRLSEEKARAEKLATAKEDFLANMSHEIRTPMNAVIGFAEQLAGTSLNSNQQGLLQPIRDSANYLLALLNDVLDYSKLDSGNFRLEEIGFKIAPILSNVQNTFEGPARQKGISLVCKEENPLTEVLIGDPLRLKQMLFNLVSNAIKFTEKGKVELIVRIEKKTENAIQLCFQVIDTGIGIEASQLAHIFQKFSQAEGKTSRKYGGTGLGLSITRQLAEQHSGEVWMESEPGKGTTAFLRIPYKIGSVEDIEVDSSSSDAQVSGLHGKQILVADDEPYNRLLIKTILQKWGIQVDTVENGKEALTQLPKKPYELVLMDLQMPELDGIGATQFIRESLESTIPIIALTATSTEKEIDQAKGAGMDEHLLKPFEEYELYQLLLKYLHPQQSGQPMPQDSPEEGKAPYNLDQLYRLSRNNKDFLLKMLKLFTESSTKSLDEMKAASASKNWEEVGMLAHKLVPRARDLGLGTIVSQLKSIELDVADGKGLAEMPQRVEQVGAALQEVIQAIQADVNKQN